MNFHYLSQKTHYRPHLLTFLLSTAVCCMLLLSGCGSTGSTTKTVSSTATVVPTPTVDASLQKQGDVQLQVFQQWIALMQRYHGNTATYQQQYTNDQQALLHAQTNTAYKATLLALNKHVQAIQIPAMKTEAQNLQQQLQQEVTSWGQQHAYHDDYDNTSYQLGFEYGPDGIGGWVQDELDSAQTVADYQQAIEDLNMYLTNFQAMITNSSDKTPYNQVHQTDMQLLQRYQMMDGKVIVISLAEQAMRVYNRGKLVNAFLVTTGRPSKPSPPGTWWVENKQSPTVFKADVPPSSPYWYPDTPINYAIQYHSNGYFIHDSWWRADYGPGTQFPHADSSGDSFSSQGSHGCVNITKDNAAWVYQYVEVNTRVVIY